MLITELFDNPAQWALDTSDRRSSNFTFSIDEINYDVDISRSAASYEDFGVYSINFSIVDSRGANNFDITNTGNQYEVFATVKDIIIDFASNHNMDALFFSSPAAETSRISLYTKMLPVLKRIGYPSNTIKTNHRNSHYFIAAIDKDGLDFATRRLSMLRSLS